MDSGRSRSSRSRGRSACSLQLGWLCRSAGAGGRRRRVVRLDQLFEVLQRRLARIRYEAPAHLAVGPGDEMIALPCGVDRQISAVGPGGPGEGVDYVLLV